MAAGFNSCGHVVSKLARQTGSGPGGPPVRGPSPESTESPEKQEGTEPLPYTLFHRETVRRARALPRPVSRKHKEPERTGGDRAPPLHAVSPVDGCRGRALSRPVSRKHGEPEKTGGDRAPPLHAVSPGDAPPTKTAPPSGFCRTGALFSRLCEAWGLCQGI